MENAESVILFLLSKLFPLQSSSLNQESVWDYFWRGKRIDSTLFVFHQTKIWGTKGDVVEIGGGEANKNGDCCWGGTNDLFVVCYKRWTGNRLEGEQKGGRITIDSWSSLFSSSFSFYFAPTAETNSYWNIYDRRTSHSTGFAKDWYLTWENRTKRPASKIKAKEKTSPFHLPSTVFTLTCFICYKDILSDIQIITFLCKIDCLYLLLFCFHPTHSNSVLNVFISLSSSTKTTFIHQQIVQPNTKTQIFVLQSSTNVSVLLHFHSCTKK